MLTEKISKLLVTGATGQIGSELTLGLREKYGGDNVVAVGHKRKPSDQLLNSGPFESLDVVKKESLERVTKKYGVDTIYHLAALLSAMGEQNPQLAWNLNLSSLYNVLEIAREQGMARIFFPSSIWVFGPNAPRINTPQETILLPTTMYGVTKVAGELLCNYYFVKYGVDVRGLRYPAIISSQTPTRGGIKDYVVAIFYEAIRNKRYTSFVREDTVLPMMYMPDCIKATIDLMEANADNIKRHDSYNITGMSFSAGELTAEIKKHIPSFSCDHRPDFRQRIADSLPMSIDDTAARKDWGWQPSYDLATMTNDMIEKISNRLTNENLR